MPAQLHVLGSPTLRRSVGRTAREVHLQSKRLGLLTYLALAPAPGWCRRQSLVGLIWPDCEESAARNALNQAIYHLRRAIGGRAIATRGHDEIAVSPALLWCDARAFQDALAAGRDEQALSLHRGPLLDGLRVDGVPEFDAWLVAERERLRCQAAEAASTLAREAQAGGSTTRSVLWLRRLLDLSPDDETALRQLMTVRRTLGDRAGALRDYRNFERRLTRDLDVEPDDETRILAERIQEEQNAGTRRVSPRSPAYADYWRGLVYWSRRTPDDMRKAVAHFRKAMERDPACSQTHAAFAMAGTAVAAAHYDIEHPDRVYSAIRSAVEKALEIDPDSPEALASLAFVQALYDRNWNAADATSLRACELAPNNPMVHHTRAVVAVYTGRLEEALSSITRAAKLEPLALGYEEIKGFYLYLARRPRQAVRQMERVLEVEPRLYLACMGLGHARAALGETDAAESAYRRAMDTSGRHPYPLVSLGVLFARTSRVRDAAAILEELTGWASSRYVRPTYVAAIQTALGDDDAAFAMLERAIGERDIHLTSIVCDPFFDSLRGDRRFPRLLGRLGLSVPPAPPSPA